MRIKNNKGQHFLEFAMLLIVVAAALAAMKIYFGRGVQARYRAATDIFGGEQYAKGVTRETNLDAPGVIIDQTIPGGLPEEQQCANIRAHVALLEKENNGEDIVDSKGETVRIEGLFEQADKLEAQASDIRQTISGLSGQNVTQTRLLEDAARALDEQAVKKREKARSNQEYINKLRSDYAKCFS